MASFEQYVCSGLHVIPAQAGIHPANLRGRSAYELDSRLRGNDVQAMRDEAANGATTPPLSMRRTACLVNFATLFLSFLPRACATY